MRLLAIFLKSEKTAGFLLMGCTAVSLLLANGPFGHDYTTLWHSSIAGADVLFWVNEALMTFFFLLIGLEIKREMATGELANTKKAMLPIIAALGGMVVPALIYLEVTLGSGFEKGFGIPMATDIAFSLGVLSLLGKRAPMQLKIFLTTLAIIDDLGAIIVIAAFYSTNISWVYLIACAACFGLLLLLNRYEVRWLWLYLFMGTLLWYCLLKAGIHPTIAGVLLAMSIPYGKGKMHPVHQLEHRLHVPVNFIIIPLFVLANTAIIIAPSAGRELLSGYGLGIILGLLLGKPLGIFFFSFVAVSSSICALPAGVRMKDILSIGFIAGIGFTMSLFICFLAFKEEAVTNVSKIAILAGSILAGITGYIMLRLRRSYTA